MPNKYKDPASVARAGEFSVSSGRKDPNSVVRASEKDPYNVVRRGESGFGSKGRRSIYKGYTGRYSMD